MDPHIPYLNCSTAKCSLLINWVLALNLANCNLQLPPPPPPSYMERRQFNLHLKCPPTCMTSFKNAPKDISTLIPYSWFHLWPAGSRFESLAPQLHASGPVRLSHHPKQGLKNNIISVKIIFRCVVDSKKMTKRLFKAQST